MGFSGLTSLYLCCPKKFYNIYLKGEAIDMKLTVTTHKN